MTRDFGRDMAAVLSSDSEQKTNKIQKKISSKWNRQAFKHSSSKITWFSGSVIVVATSILISSQVYHLFLKKLAQLVIGILSPPVSLGTSSACISYGPDLGKRRGFLCPRIAIENIIFTLLFGESMVAETKYPWGSLDFRSAVMEVVKSERYPVAKLRTSFMLPKGASGKSVMYHF
ncbi:uncharacterized protein BYT42DRAFT_543676 [Radiomyces spectabilis]|uniref:uncharacterized protein n=1 Tax=Radiomyces spectabilis TaxID=64574 RepID=UPI0022212941|nr:uncharacterized protein BYT42DRAFT_543676 [Radiomyces spectabilis]KAI8388364.1 hypothetical protein BYT42DRAFT_543676 [Radiomyces spectabilis]